MSKKSDGLVPYDAKCVCCVNHPEQSPGDSVHIIWIHDSGREGDNIGYAHIDKPGACGEYAEHVLVGELTGMDRQTQQVAE